MTNFTEHPKGRIQLEFVTHVEIRNVYRKSAVALLLETKRVSDQEEPSRFQCAMTPEQAMSIGKQLQDFAQELLAIH